MRGAAVLSKFVSLHSENKEIMTKIILSGGGTGGHIYPAVAVAEALKRKLGDQVEILFVGAEGKMEMEKVPALGYRIEGLPIAGLQRRLTLRNLAVPFKAWRSLRKARRIIRDFRPDAVAGFGGYASGPILRAAQSMGYPTLIQEQNSYAGVTNKILARRAGKICCAYEGMDKFFGDGNITLTGNPLRGSFSGEGGLREEALGHFALSGGRAVVLVVGGSLGTRTLNEMMKRWVDDITARGDIEVIWQTGKYYAAEMDAFMASRSSAGIWRGAFIDRMDLAYAAADVVVSRSGAGTVSELCLVGKPVIFVPSPNVSEDHQTKNARALVSKNAALLVPDAEAVEKAIPLARELADDPAQREELSRNIRALATPDAADRVADEILQLIRAGK